MANYNIREIACDTLVEIMEHGQFSHIYIKQVLDKYAYFEKNERSFITRLVNGTVERQIELDYIINHYSKTKVKKMKPLIRTLLRMGVYEIYYMNAVPDSATCNEYVKLAKKRGFSGLSGFVNGVLRSVVRGKVELAITDVSTKYSMPQWIVDKWTADYGEKTCQDICEGFFMQQYLCVRVNTAKISKEELVNRLESQGIKTEATDEVSTVLYISGYDNIADIKEFKEGLFYIQDYSSQLAIQAVGITESADVLDVCAAPGGKALHAASLTKGIVEARDLTEAKVALINENIERAQANNIAAKVWDATVKDEDSIGKFDVVIADLPCSGLGIIRKKPDIKYNQSPESLAELVELQKQILDTVCDYVKDDGILSYSTCTINMDENERQALSFVERHPEFKIERMEQLFPNGAHDGFFICILKK